MSQVMFFDAHLDLAMNAMEWNRDLRWSIDDIRQSEKGMTDKPDRAQGMVNFECLRKGNIGIVVATQIARYTKKSNLLPSASWHSPEQAWAQTQAQLAWYETMASTGHIRIVTNKAELDTHLDQRQNHQESTPIGLIRSLEGADSLIDLTYLERAYRSGLRAIGPAHYGPGTYAHGTHSTGGIGQKGKELLREMEALNMILDVTHLCDESFWEAIDLFKGHLWASHSNCRALVPHERQFSDDQLKEIIRRDGVIGVAFDAWMLVPEWQRGISTPQSTQLSLQTVADHIDHICQLSGNAKHVGIGSDLDGAFGREQAPADMDTIADVQNLTSILASRHYSQIEIEQICAGNWIHFLRTAWA